MLRSDLCDLRDVYIVVKGTITTKQNTNINNDGITNHLFLKTMLRLSAAFQR